jgi:hypothetical protein
MEFISGKNQDIDACRASSRKVDSTFIVRLSIFRFSCQYSSTPLFHHSIWLNKKMTIKYTVIPKKIVEIPDTFQAAG